MRFTWGTAIAIFLLLFIVTIVSFAIFAYNQDVNLVHQDYYEKGVDYSQQMDRDARSLRFAGQIGVETAGDAVVVSFPETISSQADSVEILFFRPSDHHLDNRKHTAIASGKAVLGDMNLISGRYIIKLSWNMEGMEYEVDKELIVK